MSEELMAEVMRAGRVIEPCHGSELAVYSDDRPVEFWRRIPGFQESREA